MRQSVNGAEEDYFAMGSPTDAPRVCPFMYLREHLEIFEIMHTNVSRVSSWFPIGWCAMFARAKKIMPLR